VCVGSVREYSKSASLFLVFLITPLRRNSPDESVMMKLIIVRHNKDEMVLLMIQQEDLQLGSKPKNYVLACS
jgi:hypothetical protein